MSAHNYATDELALRRLEKIFSQPLKRIDLSKETEQPIKPYCDCRELNAINGNYLDITGYKVSKSAKDRDSDVAFELFVTTLNEKGRCKHCNYEPLWKRG